MITKNKSRLRCEFCKAPMLLEEENYYLLKARALKFEKDGYKRSQVKCKRCRRWNKVEKIILIY